MHYQQITHHGEDFIGLLGHATEKYCILSNDFPKTDILKTDILRTRIYSTNLVGMFCTGNSKGLLLPYFIEDDELEKIKKFLEPLGVEAEKINDRHTALGNLIAANDNACILSPKLLDYKTLEDVLQVETISMSLGGHEEVGACIMPTNKGFYATPDASDRLKELERIFKVPGDVGTVNFGIPFVKSGLIANSNGYITGNRTSGIELGEIDSALGFI